jgi:excisionase family DNA binding protein
LRFGYNKYKNLKKEPSMKKPVRTLKEVLEQGGLMDVAELAQYLKCSVPSVYTWAKAGKIPHVKISTLGLRFRPDEILAWQEGKVG